MYIIQPLAIHVITEVKALLKKKLEETHEHPFYQVSSWNYTSVIQEKANTCTNIKYVHAADL